MIRRILILASSLAVLFLAACSTTGDSYRQAFIPHVDRPGLNPLIDSPVRTQTECKGVELFSAGEKLAGFKFECPDLDVEATLNELRDAGWRIEKMNIGKQVVESNESGTPLSIQIRKVY